MSQRTHNHDKLWDAFGDKLLGAFRAFGGQGAYVFALEVGVVCHWQPLSHVPLQSQCAIPCRQLLRPKNTYSKPLVSNNGEPSLVMRASELKDAMMWPWRRDTPKRQGSFVLL